MLKTRQCSWYDSGNQRPNRENAELNKYKVLTGVAMLLVAAIGWGGMFPVAKAALSVVDAFYLAIIRYGITASVFVAFLLWTEGPAALSLDGKGLRLALLGASGFAGFGLLAFYGLARSRPEHGAIIMATQPLIAALVVWATRGTRPALVTLASIVVALTGILLVITRGHVTGILAGGTAFGDLLMFVSAICWVAYTLGAASFPGWSPLRYTAITCMLGVPAILICTASAWLTGISHAPDPALLGTVVWQMAYIIVIASILGVLAWNIGNQALGSANGVLFINFVPITAFAIEIAQGHRFEAIELAGAAMVIGALVANTLMLRAPGQIKTSAAAAATPAHELPLHCAVQGKSARPLCAVPH
jgi:drug/metabolite transporter (DMT)-like permease